jgi:hypothetical protein
MKAALVVLSVLLCWGVHAAEPPATPTPACQNQRQCEAMWAAAKVAIGAATGMPNRLVEVARIETYAAMNDSQLTGVVTRVPAGQEGYKFIVDLSCYGSTQCEDRIRAGTELFNTLVINAGAPFGPLPEPTTIDRQA